MSFYTQLKLPPLKLTHHQPKTKSVKKKVLFRGVEAEGSSVSEPAADPINDDDLDTTPALDQSLWSAPASVEDEPTHHELQSKSSQKGWDLLCRKFLSAFTECSSMPKEEKCVFCVQPALFRCQECGPCIFYCKNCWITHHQVVNLFHVPEKWEEDHFVVTNLRHPLVDVLPPHSCSSVQESSILCIDEHGIEHSIRFVWCNCESLAVTLVRAQLWPATPHHPKRAFTFKLLDLAESLLLECQVALRDFCNALYFRSPYPVFQRKDIYSSLIDSFEEYRFFKHETRHLTFLSDDLDSGNVCPACPKGEGKAVYSLDALFGLPRKKSAGTSVRQPIHGDIFFCDQSGVDEFVNISQPVKACVKECSDFLAGNMLRSANRYRALDETALFGSACRHEFPALFFNLKHGERLAYAVYLIEQLVKQHQSAEMYITYDIACMLHKHLKFSGQVDLLEKISLCLPTFHCYGHKAACQILFGPLRCRGIGLSDGEVMERLWSYLRRFSRMTKEMRPSHRVDVLVHALVYYGIQKKEKMAKLLVMRWTKAKMVKSVAEETFHMLANTFEGGFVSDDEVKQWLTEESTLAVTEKSSSRIMVPQWKCEYFQMLCSYFESREKLNHVTQREEKLAVYHEIQRLDKQLLDMEKRHHLSCRWSQNNSDYKQLCAEFSREKRSHIVEAMWAASSRRQFLLKLKAKYADGQKIAKKLAVQIAKETGNIKALLPEYNACQAAMGSPGMMSPEEALDSNRLSVILRPYSSISSTDKQEIIDAFLRRERASEEVVMLEVEMKNTTAYYTNKCKVLQDCMDSFCQRGDSPLRRTESCEHAYMYDRGALALLKRMHIHTAKKADECEKLFVASNPELDSESELELSDDEDC